MANAPPWADDPRLQQALLLCQRGEVLRAESLLRSILREHPECHPALSVLAGFAADREDFAQAVQLLDQALQGVPDDPFLLFRRAQLDAATGQPVSAAQRLKCLLEDNPEHGPAWLMLADVHDQLGDSLGALRARYRALAQAHQAGRWTSQETTEPGLLAAVQRHTEALHRTRREYLFGAFEPVREEYGSRALARVDHALRGYLGDFDATPRDARQRPKFFYFPGLPAGPYHDPYLHPWALTLKDAWRDIQAEALELLAVDADFESFLGLTPGRSAPGYVGGENPLASWDAYFFYRHGQRFDSHHTRCPLTSTALESIELCRIRAQAPEVCFSVIRPRSTIMPHYGVTNTRLVMHLPLRIPEGCALNVIDGGEHPWKEGELMMFDDTFQHEAWNRSDEPRLILLMDCWNPHLTPPERQAVQRLVEAIDSIEN